MGGRKKKKKPKRKATIANMIGDGFLGSSGFAMLPKLVRWAIIFAEKETVLETE